MSPKHFSFWKIDVGKARMLFLNLIFFLYVHDKNRRSKSRFYVCEEEEAGCWEGRKHKQVKSQNIDMTNLVKCHPLQELLLEKLLGPQISKI